MRLHRLRQKQKIPVTNITPNPVTVQGVSCRITSDTGWLGTTRGAVVSPAS
jgi:hypothetical protein